MPADHDLSFAVAYVAVMALVGAANLWLVYRGYRRCMKHLEDRASAGVVRNDVAEITFGSMIAFVWGILVGINIAGIDREHRWIETAVVICVLVFTGLLSLRPLRQLTHRLSDSSAA